MIDLNKLAAEIHAAAVEKGFWDVEDAVEKHIAKMHSELSEAVQADRAGIMYEVEHEGAKPEGVAAELADFAMMALDFQAQIGGKVIEGFEAAAEDLKDDEEALCVSKETTLPAMVNEVHYIVSRAVYEEKPALICGVVVIVEMWLYVRGYDLWQIIRAKMEYNKSRPKLHGRAY